MPENKNSPNVTFKAGGFNENRNNLGDARIERRPVGLRGHDPRHYAIRNDRDPIVTSTAKQALETQKIPLQATLMKRAITQAIVADAAYVPLTATPFGIFETKSTHGFSFYGGEIYLSGVWLP